MPLVPADLRIDARWMFPMTARELVLERHSLLVRDGRILDVLPTNRAAQTYEAGVTLNRGAHVLMPGMVNADASGAGKDGRSVLRAIAQMLTAGITSFGDRHFPAMTTARAAQDQGIRAVIGMTVADLALRDEYRGHPLVSTVFAPLDANGLEHGALAKLATLADELDAGITLEVNRSTSDVTSCLKLHDARPLERLWDHGLLTPALNAVHMTVCSEEDLALAQRTGISVTLCPQMDLYSGNGLPPAPAFAAAGMRMALGSANTGRLAYDTWGELKLLALMMQSAGVETWSAWDAVAAATCGGAAVLGLDADVGTLQVGKWADLCCAELAWQDERSSDPLRALVFGGGRDMVTDVWVAGRQLLSQRELTRLDTASWQEEISTR